MASEKAGRDLDALVAERVMELAVVTKRAAADRYEGWSVQPAQYIGTEGYPVEGSDDLQPVYMRHCCCDVVFPERTLDDQIQSWMDLFDVDRETATAKVQRSNDRKKDEHAADLARWGHSWHCLDVVPEYSTEIAAAWEVVERLDALGLYFTLDRLISDGVRFWRAEVYHDHPDGGRCGDIWEDGDTAPLAICLAALSAVKASSGEPVVATESTG